VTFYFDPDQLEAELMSLAPQDAAVIRELCGLIRTLKSFKPVVSVAPEVMGLADYMRMMPDMMRHGKAYQAFFKYGKVTMGELGSRFKNAGLGRMFAAVWGEGFPVSLFASVMAWGASRTAGYPLGGSIRIAKSMAQRYLALGGSIRYRSRVEAILIENGAAAGVRLADGSEHRADYVISAADGHETITQLLGGQYGSEQTRHWYQEYPTFPPYLQISLGVGRDLSGLPATTFYLLDKPLYTGGQEVHSVIIRNYAFDASAAPEGKTSLAVRLFADYAYWEKLYTDKPRYRAEKDALAHRVIDAVDSYLGGIRECVECIDVATPATYVRYTGTWKGAAMSWLPTTENFGKNIAKTLPSLSGFYMAGQWLTPGGGLPTALKSGRDAIQMICKKEKLRFRAQVDGE
jgi:phytoene dehydrogenase-like protein